MNPFKDTYSKLMNPMPSLPMYGLGEIVTYASFRWEVVGFEADKKEGCWIYELKRVDGSDKTESGINELGLMKSYEKTLVLKPGDGQHSPKWDRCVAEVKESGSAENAYAVCNAMMGKAMFKTMDDDSFIDKVKMYMHKLGIAGAGPVPNSLLADQDLETHKSMDLDSFSVWYYDESGAQKCAVFNNLTDAEAFASVVDAMGFKDVSIKKGRIEKGQVEQTGKKLEQLADKAESAGTDEQSDLVENIKAVQVKRQKATILERAKETAKSFKQVWSNLNKNND